MKDMLTPFRSFSAMKFYLYCCRNHYSFCIPFLMHDPLTFDSLTLVHALFYAYCHADASFLDEWSFDQFQSLLNRSNEDPKLKQLLLQDNLVIFLHLLGCDSNGHAHRPYSSIYLNNVKVVDGIAERVYNVLESYFKDNQTAYIFTADHGMSDKGRKIFNPFDWLVSLCYTAK